MQRSGGPNNKWTNIRTISGNETSVTIGNLDSDTKYLFKLYSHNRHGTGKIPSEVLQVETEGEWLVPLIHLLNTSTRMPFEILFVMLIEAIVILFAFGVQCLHENENTAKCSCRCIQLT